MWPGSDVVADMAARHCKRLRRSVLLALCRCEQPENYVDSQPHAVFAITRKVCTTTLVYAAQYQQSQQLQYF